MKLTKITSFYPNYIRTFYERRQGLAMSPFEEQQAALDYDAFGWSDYWSHALDPLGYEVQEITLNAEPLQRAWAKENSCPDPLGMKLGAIAVEQVKRFRPDILWFEDASVGLLSWIRSEVPSIRLVIGWSGSAVLDLTTWGQMDLILSCAPESVEHFRRLGLRSRQLHHGFDPRVLSRTGEVEKTIDFCFAGQLVGAGTYYVRREHILEMLTQDTKMEIFASLPNSRARALRALLRAGAYCTVYALRAAGVSEKTLCSLPVLSRAAAWKSMSRKRSNPKLKPFLRPAVYGIEMFRTLMSAKVALNVHADPMPRFASNARLFEITGAGTCMVTERLENIHDLFEPDREVVTYGSPEECVEKVKWLMEHAEEREKIARAGQARTLRDHTWSKRAEEFDSIIKRMV